MEKKAHFYAYSWDKTNIHVSFTEDLDSESYVPIGSTMLKLPSDLIPNDETFSTLAFNKKLSVAKRKVTACEVALDSAKEDLQKLVALPSPEYTGNYASAKEAFEDDVAF